MIETAVFDTKPYDREYLARAACAEHIAWRFHEFRLSAETAPAAKGAQAVCIFVNDHADRACLESLAAHIVERGHVLCADGRPEFVSEIPERLPNVAISLHVRRDGIFPKRT